MKLVDLNPRFVGAGGEGISDKDGNPSPARHGIGLLFTCPCGKCDEYHDCFVSFANQLDGGPPLPDERPLWQRTGDTFETLTLTPSILRSVEKGGCGWHGFITNGEVR
jgi:hypothetical protein